LFAPTPQASFHNHALSMPQRWSFFSFVHAQGRSPRGATNHRRVLDPLPSVSILLTMVPCCCLKTRSLALPSTTSSYLSHLVRLFSARLLPNEKRLNNSCVLWIPRGRGPSPWISKCMIQLIPANFYPTTVLQGCLCQPFFGL